MVPLCIQPLLLVSLFSRPEAVEAQVPLWHREATGRLELPGRMPPMAFRGPLWAAWGVPTARAAAVEGGIPRVVVAAGTVEEAAR